MFKTPRMKNFEGQFPPEINEISGHIVDAAFAIHRRLGPGLLENAYEACLKYELNKRGLNVECQKPIPLQYDEINLDVGFRADMVVAGKVVVELKTVENLMPVHRAQVHTYLKLTDCPLGLLINFNVSLIKDGIERIILTKTEDVNAE